MKILFQLYKDKWFVPLYFAGFLGIIGSFTISIQNEIILYLSLGLPFFALISSGVFGIHKIIRKNYKTGILQLFLTGTMGYIGLYYISFYLLFYPYDYYANGLTIPKNIQIFKPVGWSFNEGQEGKMVNSDDGLSKQEYRKKYPYPAIVDFTIFNAGQPGIYSYDLNYKSSQKGELFLKAFEITKNDPLSERYLTNRSRIVIDTVLNEFILYTSKNVFTIYEGDWGEPYAARFELWFKPKNEMKAIKVLEKNYKIEGWQR